MLKILLKKRNGLIKTVKDLFLGSKRKKFIVSSAKHSGSDHRAVLLMKKGEYSK